MKRKRNLKTAMLLMLRKAGYLCKKPAPAPRGIRVSKSIQPDGTTTYYDKPLKEVPINPNSFQSELHVYHEVKKLSNPKK
jgi:hypothetical protein